MDSDCSAGDGEWLEKIRGGDRSVLELLFRSHYEGLCGFVRRYLGSRAIAEEIVQDVFLALWERRGRLEFRGSAKTYLYTAARNHALNHLKRRRVEDRWVKRAALEIEHSRCTTQDDLDYRDLVTAVREAVEQLPQRRRQVFTLIRQGGLSYAEVAEVLGISVKTVETQMGRALKALRSSLRAFLSQE